MSSILLMDLTVKYINVEIELRNRYNILIIIICLPMRGRGYQSIRNAFVMNGSTEGYHWWYICRI